MRICIVLEACSAGSGRHGLDLAGGLAARGHDIHFAYSPRRADRLFLEELDAIAGVLAFRVPMRRAPHPSDIGAAVAIARHLVGHGPFDVVHGVSSKGGALARLAGALARRPVCYTPAAFVTMSPTLRPAKRRLFAAAERMLSLLTTRIVVMSDLERRHAAELGLAAEKVVQIPIGRDAFPRRDRAQVLSALGIAPETAVVGFVGRLEEQKAPEVLMRALARLPVGTPPHRLAIVGGGTREQALRAMAAELGVADRLIWLGEVRAADFLAGFDFLVLPSDYEGFPYVFLDALQAGLPIVSTPVGGASDVIVPGVNGFVVPHRDADALAGAMAQLLRDRELRAAMAGASEDRARLFGLDVMLDRTEAAYRECAPHHRAPRPLQAARRGPVASAAPPAASD